MKISSKTIKILVACVVAAAVALMGCAAVMMQKANEKEKAAKEIIKASEEQNQTVADNTGEGVVTPTPTPEEIDVEALNDVEFEDVEDNIYINQDEVNIREEPTKDGEVAAVAPLGKLYKRTGKSAEWSRIEEESEEYYVHNDFISEQQPEGTETDADNPADVAENDTTAAGTKGKTVIIDPGHQAHGDSSHEPIGPGASTTKPRVSSGTSGSVSGWNEYELNLAVSLKLRDELVKRGYTVYMTRETHDVSISNKERAEFATQKGGDILVRIHANGSDDSSVNGALCMAPSNSNQFLASNLITESQRLSKCVVDQYVAATGFNNQGVYITDEMSGINWSTMPVTIVEMGFMTNASDDANMADPAMEEKMVQGISNGIDDYFG